MIRILEEIKISRDATYQFDVSNSMAVKEIEMRLQRLEILNLSFESSTVQSTQPKKTLPLIKCATNSRPNRALVFCQKPLINV